MKGDIHTTLDEQLAERVLVLDGAMGTILQRLDLDEADFRGERFADHPGELKDYDVLSLTQPELVSRIHHDYLAAGSDIIKTNTFNANAVMHAGAESGSLVREMNVAAARLARAACDHWTARTPDKPRWVAGTLGPTNRSLSIAPAANAAAFQSIAFHALEAAYDEQIQALVDGGCDILLIETVFDPLSARAAMAAAEKLFSEGTRRLPLMISATISATGRMLSGDGVEDLWRAIADAAPWSVGLNCSHGALAMRSHLEALSTIADSAISGHPSAGLPNARGEYPETPEEVAGVLGDLAGRGLLHIAGGCCGTTPDYVKAIAEAVRHARPRQPGRAGDLGR